MARMPAMLAQPVDTFALPAGWAAEPKWDGFRVLLAHGQEQTLPRSRHGAYLTPGFPELVAEADADVALDGAGRWRHPLRLLRLRSDLDPADVPRFGQGNEPAVGCRCRRCWAARRM